VLKTVAANRFAIAVKWFLIYTTVCPTFKPCSGCLAHGWSRLDVNELKCLSQGGCMDTAGRRKFLVTLLTGGAAAAAAALCWPLYRYLAPAHGSSSAASVKIPEGEVGEGQAKFFQYAGSAAVLVRKRGGELVAFSAVCTHLGCIVQWEKDAQGFLCPCHGGHYSADGAVISGPPPKALAPIPFRVADGTITIGEGA
jgi:cytochrome b6-f complex iron-sulfur subunit